MHKKNILESGHPEWVDKLTQIGGKFFFPQELKEVVMQSNGQMLSYPLTQQSRDYQSYMIQNSSLDNGAKRLLTNMLRDCFAFNQNIHYWRDLYFPIPHTCWQSLNSEGELQSVEMAFDSFHGNVKCVEFGFAYTDHQSREAIDITAGRQKLRIDNIDRDNPIQRIRLSEIDMQEVINELPEGYNSNNVAFGIKVIPQSENDLNCGIQLIPTMVPKDFEEIVGGYTEGIGRLTGSQDFRDFNEMKFQNVGVRFVIVKEKLTASEYNGLDFQWKYRAISFGLYGSGRPNFYTDRYRDIYEYLSRVAQSDPVKGLPDLNDEVGKDIRATFDSRMSVFNQYADNLDNDVYSLELGFSTEDYNYVKNHIKSELHTMEQVKEMMLWLEECQEVFASVRQDCMRTLLTEIKAYADKHSQILEIDKHSAAKEFTMTFLVGAAATIAIPGAQPLAAISAGLWIAAALLAEIDPFEDKEITRLEIGTYDYSYFDDYIDSMPLTSIDIVEIGRDFYFNDEGRELLRGTVGHNQFNFGSILDVKRQVKPYINYQMWTVALPSMFTIGEVYCSNELISACHSSNWNLSFRDQGLLDALYRWGNEPWYYRHVFAYSLDALKPDADPSKLFLNLLSLDGKTLRTLCYKNVFTTSSGLTSVPIDIGLLRDIFKDFDIAVGVKRMLSQSLEWQSLSRRSVEPSRMNFGNWICQGSNPLDWYSPAELNEMEEIFD